MRRTHALGAAIVAALTFALPTIAGAHPAVYETTQQLAKYNEVQTLTIDATGGDFKPSANAPEIPYGSPAHVVAWALAQDADVGANATTFVPNVWVTKAADVYTIMFQGAKAGTNVPQLVPDGTSLTGGAGTAVPATVVPGSTSTLAYPAVLDNVNELVRKALIANDGFAVALTEANSVATDGWLNLQKNPGTFRTTQTNAQWIQFPAAQTGFQTHATCWDDPTVAGDLDATLNTVANRIAAQKDKDGQIDSFFNYVPWQADGSGLEDKSSQWISLIKTATGQDLTGATLAQARAKCIAAGGIFVPADSIGANVSSKYATEVADEAVAKATTPLNAAISTLSASKATLEAQLAAMRAVLVSPTAKVADEDAGALLLVDGPELGTAKVTLTVSAKNAKALKLKSTTIGTTTTKLNAHGSAIVRLRASLLARKALGKVTGGVPAVVTTTVDGASDTAAITLK